MSTNAGAVPGRCNHDSSADCTGCASCLARDSDAADGLHDVPVVSQILLAGEHVFRAGERFEAVHVVRHGVVKSYTATADGRERVSGFHYPGDLIGLDSVGSGVYLCSAQLLTTSTLCALPFEQLSTLCLRSKSAHSRFMARMSRQYETERVMSSLLGLQSIQQRLAGFLLELSEVQLRGGASPSELNLPMSQADLASYLSSPVSALRAMLAAWEGSGVVEIRGARTDILDYPGLVALAGDGADERGHCRAVA